MKGRKLMGDYRTEEEKAKDFNAEHKKVERDMVIYGQGYYRETEDGIKHVPIEEFLKHNI